MGNPEARDVDAAILGDLSLVAVTSIVQKSGIVSVSAISGDKLLSFFLFFYYYFISVSNYVESVDNSL